MSRTPATEPIISLLGTPHHDFPIDPLATPKAPPGYVPLPSPSNTGLIPLHVSRVEPRSDPTSVLVKRRMEQGGPDSSRQRVEDHV